MKRNIILLSLLALSIPAFAGGTTANTPTVIPCTVEKNHKCVYPEATLKDKHIYQKLERFLRKIGK